MPDARSDRRGFEGEGTGARKGFVFEGSDLPKATPSPKTTKTTAKVTKAPKVTTTAKASSTPKTDAEDDHDVPDKAGQGGDQVREEVQHHVDDHALDDHAHDDNHD